ncbi:hypothetical protein CQW23_20647 [Capsicum baccatum]|uniref:BHLH domain-containing protein n=1 Tax=Capsicum baccatum TaxID=33114 RepID=A0A2G2W975_CAPBA|nr:hypothetical protein CQW23_20647 [Capsicum baccatum]
MGNSEVRSFLNSDNGQLVGGRVKFVGDKLPDSNRFNTCQPLTTVKEVDKASLGGKKRCLYNKKKGGNERGEPKSGEDEDGGRESSHELHIWTETERRKRMRNMFVNLQTLISHLQPKARGASGLEQLICGALSTEDIFDVWYCNDYYDGGIDIGGGGGFDVTLFDVSSWRC